MEDVGELRDLDVQLPVGERAAVARLAFPDQGRLVARGRPDVPVNAVDGDVQLAAGEPLRVRRLPLQHVLPRLEPLELGGAIGPVSFVIRGSGIENGVGADVRAPAELCGRRELPVLLEQDVDVGHGLGRSDFPKSAWKPGWLSAVTLRGRLTTTVESP
jgi:hypothetical protein